MTQVSFGRGTRRQTLRLTGHATGSEQVCAAISGIVYSLLGYLDNQPEEAETREEPGYALASDGRGAALDAAFDMAVIGLLQIAQEFPDHVKVTVRSTDGPRPG